ncbi:hypothetical protein X777_10832 [Ooceraea biroi]|uniref:Uncharacterized protein n=1 Tax=Ooceraea biroi TaxID=2015173 RepID=A0A026W402_OOCBI|nr:hypothetical protein X777_10832 [Ooceraea biroi]
MHHERREESVVPTMDTDHRHGNHRADEYFADDDDELARMKICERIVAQRTDFALR